MRHNKSYKKLGRDTAHRVAMLKNLSKSLIASDKIDTTLTRAKELRKFVERLITLGKVDTIHNRRQAFAKLRDRDLVNKLFTELSVKYVERPGGYTRIIKTGIRRGDGAEKARIEFV